MVFFLCLASDVSGRNNRRPGSERGDRLYIKGSIGNFHTILYLENNY
jgi:hypothetical protein